MGKYLILMLLFASCQSSPHGHVQTSWDRPMGSCQEVGQVIGSAHSRDGAREKALEDLKYQAALKSGNYVRVLAVAPHGASVRGIAYRCQ